MTLTVTVVDGAAWALFRMPEISLWDHNRDARYSSEMAAVDTYRVDTDMLLFSKPF